MRNSTPTTFAAGLAMAVTLALAFAAPAASQPGRDDRATGGHGMGASGGHNGTGHDMARMSERWDHMESARRDAALARAESHRMFAKFSYEASTGQVTGRFVAFHLAAAQGAIHDVRILDGANSTSFLAGVTPSSFSATTAPRVTGAVLHVPGANVSFMAHNNPTGGIQWHARANVTLTFALATGATVGFNESREVQVRAGTIHAHILTNGNASIQVAGSTVTVRLAAGEAAMFRAHPASQETTVLHGENKAFKGRTLGASVRIADGGGVALQDDTPITVGVETRTIRAGRAEMEVSSEHHGAQVVFLTFDAETLTPRNAANLSVELSGTKAVVLPSVDAVLAAPGLAAFVRGDAALGTVQVVLRVPHFSSYTLAVTDLSIPAPGATTSPGSSPAATTSGAVSPSGTTTAKGSPAPAAALLALAVLAAAAVVLRRRA